MCQLVTVIRFGHLENATVDDLAVGRRLASPIRAPMKRKGKFDVSVALPFCQSDLTIDNIFIAALVLFMGYRLECRELEVCDWLRPGITQC